MTIAEKSKVGAVTSAKDNKKPKQEHSHLLPQQTAESSNLTHFVDPTQSMQSSSNPLVPSRHFILTPQIIKDQMPLKPESKLAV